MSNRDRGVYYPRTGLRITLQRTGILPRYRVHAHYGRPLSTVAMATFGWPEAIDKYDLALDIADEHHGERMDAPPE